ncbi:MAG TPA: hypothetical protein VFJ64_09130 [Solirubrobacterales bacterium]|nr:hypothetical protein [Solirubrobacterales bacterium]
MGRLRILATALVVGTAALCAAPAAQATFHKMSIREVYPGGDASYVELQMWTSGQNFVEGRHLVAYDTAGKPVDNFSFAADVANGANQSTILVADTNYPVVFDERPAPDASDAGLNLSPAGGAVCWVEGSPPDCIAWGSFAGPLPAGLKVGNPASPGGVQAGMALRRSIANGCPTLFDPPPTDDSDDSATDFAEVEPNPRDNAIVPTETPCQKSSGGGGGGQGGSGGNPPQTLLKRTPPHKTHDRTPSFRFAADERGVTFQCKLDGKPYKACHSPFTTKKLSLGRHVFRVRARDDSGRLDPSPASYAFKVIRG